MPQGGVTVAIAPNGRVVIPATMRSVLGVTGGGKLVARLADGALILEPFDLAIRRAQAQVAQYVPAGVDLAEGLIARRRAAAALE